MRIWGFGSRPQKQVKPSSIDLSTVNPAPVDPTLDNAASEIANSIREKSGTIAQLSREIEAMTTDLLKQFEATTNAKK